METIKTLIVGALVNGWVYGEKLYFFMIGRNENHKKQEVLKCRAGT